MATIERSIYPELVSELESNKIMIVTGPRQAGKTTLLKALADELKSKKQQVHYYNFDRSVDLDFFNKQNKVEAFLNIRSLKARLYIFIDEVQRKKNAGTFFKYFYDAGVNAKFIFSGSSSIELMEQFGDALTGRKRVYTLFPLSAGELGASRLGEEFDYAKQSEPTALEKFNELCEELLIWGSYPEVATRKTEAAKFKALEELYESYVQKDVKDLLRVKNVSGFNHLVKLLAHLVGQPLVVEDLVRQTNLHANTVNSYLDILEGTMIAGLTENYNPDFSDKLPKSKRYYFLDNGMRNFALGQLQTGFRTDYRQLAVNLLYSELRKQAEMGDLAGAFSIHHYQTYSDNNVDFVLVPKAGKAAGSLIPIAVNYPEDSTKLGKKIHEYLNSTKPKKFTIVTKEYAGTQEVKGCEVTHLPLAEFLTTLPELLN